jgi:hypothetical protein
MTTSNTHKDEHQAHQSGRSRRQEKDSRPAVAVGSFLIWLMHQLWRLLTLKRRRRVAAAQGAERIMKAAQERRDELQKIADKEADRAFKQGDLNRILKGYDFNSGKSLGSGKYAPLHDLMRQAANADTLHRELNIPIPKRPMSAASEEELWDAIGGRSPDIIEALGHLLVDGDPAAQNSAAEILIHLRRELTPIVHPDDHIKHTAELAARVKVRDISAEWTRPVLNKVLRGLERKARWMLIRELRPEPGSQRRSSDPGRSGIVR